MKTERLQIRIDARLKKQAEKVAQRQQTSLSAMVTQYLRHAVEQDRLERAAEEVEQI